MWIEGTRRGLAAILLRAAVIGLDHVKQRDAQGELVLETLDLGISHNNAQSDAKFHAHKFVLNSVVQVDVILDDTDGRFQIKRMRSGLIQAQSMLYIE